MGPEPEPIPVDFNEEDAQLRDLSEDKRAMRAAASRAVRGLTCEERAEKSRAVCAAIAEMPEFASARSIAMYCALADEVDVSFVMETAISRGKDVLLPVTCADRNDRTMTFVSVEDPICDLAEGPFGALEPRRGLPLNDVSNLDFVILPGRAFDALGGRLGRGGGHYDTFLSRLKPHSHGGALLLGAAFACQLVECVPMELRDVRIDAIASENGVTRRGS